MFSTSGIINALHAEGVVHVISSGVSGKVQMSTAGSSADLRYMERNILSNITIDTTIAQTLSVSVQYTSNPAGTWLELYGLIVEKLVMV